MKFLVFSKSRTGQNPPESVDLFQQTQDWMSARLADGTLDCAYNLPAGGGVAIVNADSHEALTEVLSSYPLQPWTSYEVHPLSDVKHVFDLAIKAFSG
jgi:muconolactone delta-isomerase